MADKNKITVFENEGQLKKILEEQHIKQIINYLGDEKQAHRFLSSVRASTQRLPELLKCTPISVVNSFMTMAQLGFMPSGVSGEAYVLPYKNEAQFQLGYQGLVTLFYRSGVKEIAAEIVYDNDKFEFVNGQIHHTPDVFSDNRGKAKGAYVIVKLSSGGVLSKVMSKKEIMAIGQKFSKSFRSDFSPWNEKNDPQLWMWKKTVLKQIAKLVPKNETINFAIAEDNKDSIIGDRLESAMKDSEALSMGNLLKNGNKNKEAEEDQNQDGSTDAEGPQVHPQDGEVIE